MIRNNILINTETRAIKNSDYNFLGVAGENEVEQLVFQLTAFINGIGIIEIQKGTEKHFIELEKQDESYVLDIKNSLLSDCNEILMQLHITTENTEVFKSKIFSMKVFDQIHATETIPEEYPEWIDTANEKIIEMLALEESFEQAEQARNQAVQEAIQNIEDLTEEYNENARVKTEEFDEFADNRKDELQAISDTARDFVSAVTFTTIEENFETGNLEVNNEESLGNMGFQFNYDTGNLEVEING